MLPIHFPSALWETFNFNGLNYSPLDNYKTQFFSVDITVFVFFHVPPPFIIYPHVWFENRTRSICRFFWILNMLLNINFSFKQSNFLSFSFQPHCPSNSWHDVLDSINRIFNVFTSPLNIFDWELAYFLYICLSLEISSIHMIYWKWFMIMLRNLFSIF